MIWGAMFEGRNLENPATPLSGDELAEWISDRQGVTVNPETALKLAAVYSCVYVLASSLAQLPAVVMRKMDGDRIEAGTDHPAYYLLPPGPGGGASGATLWPFTFWLGPLRHLVGPIHVDAGNRASPCSRRTLRI